MLSDMFSKRKSSELKMQLQLAIAGHSRSAHSHTYLIRMINTEHYQSCVRIPPSMIFFECIKTMQHDHSNSARSGSPLSMFYIRLVIKEMV